MRTATDLAGPQTSHSARWAALLPTGSAWAGPVAVSARRAARIGAALAAVAFLLLATDAQPWWAFDRGPFTSDFYDVQARAISRGDLDVPPAVAGIEGFPTDSGTHFYFGLVPALARLPISASTDALDGRLVVASMVAGLVVACLAAARLLQRARAVITVDVTRRAWTWVTGAFAFAVGVSTPLLWLSSDTLVYHEAELWAAALALVGFDRVVAWWGTRRTVDAAWASVAAALAWSTRSSSGTGPAIALGGLAVVLAARRHWRSAALALAAAAVPFLLYAAVNFARFGTLLSIPLDEQITTQFSADRQAALADNGGSLFGVKFLPSTGWQYLRPDTLEANALLPWFTWAPKPEPIGDVTFDTIDRSSSLPATAPAFVVATVIGVVQIVRRRVPAAWGLSMLGAAAATLPTLTIAFIAHRYLVDFVPLVVVGAALGLAASVAWATCSRQRRNLLLGASAVLVTAGLVVNVGLAQLARRLYLLGDPAARRDFVALQYSVHDLLGGGVPPQVERVEALGPVADDGDVVIVGDCDGLYRSDGEEWRLLEQRAGGAQRAVVEGTALGPVVSAAHWSIELAADGAGRRLVYRGRSTVTGAPLDAEGTLRIDVAADPVIPIVTATADGEPVLQAFLEPAEGPLVPGPGWTAVPVEAELCADLLARMA